MATARSARPVQVPGAPTTDTSAAAPDTDTKAVTDLDAADATAAPSAVTVLKGKDYSQIHSSEVDATKLTKSVLCKDGWVVPNLPAQAPIRA